MGLNDGYFSEKLRAEVEAEVSATIKLIMTMMEDLASLPPELAGEPVAFSRARQTIIRRVWNLSKECIRYGAATAVQRA